MRAGEICDKRGVAEVKGKGPRRVGRPALLFGLRTEALTKKQEAELEVTELRSLQFSWGVMKMDRLGNKHIRGTKFGVEVREARLRWFGHMPRRDTEYIGRRTLKWSY